MQEELGVIKSHTFNNKIIIAINSKWIDYFNSKEPTFKAVIQNGNYILVGPKVSLKPGPTSNPLLNEVDDTE